MPESKIISLPTLKQTMELGNILGNQAKAGQIITLAGDLGAGKTTLTQAIGQGLGVPLYYYITSPTFSILHEYPGRIPLYHMDLYRLSGEEEIEDLGLSEYLYGAGLSVVEWPDRLGSLLPKNRLHIELTFAPGEGRIAVLNALGTGLDGLLNMAGQIGYFNVPS
jgi:tRNA threonylcarbamoyladenosine biosynthesis protein TsaE